MVVESGLLFSICLLWRNMDIVCCVVMVFIALKVCLIVVSRILSLFFRNFHEGYMRGCFSACGNDNEKVYFPTILYKAIN